MLIYLPMIKLLKSKLSKKYLKQKFLLLKEMQRSLFLFICAINDCTKLLSYDINKI